MGRWLWSSLAALIAILGIAFSVMNFQQVSLAIGIGTLTLPLGVLVLLALLAGAVIAGLLLWAAVILPLRFRLRALEKTHAPDLQVR
jgi:uncharacterized integral membrane protein